MSAIDDVWYNLDIDENQIPICREMIISLEDMMANLMLTENYFESKMNNRAKVALTVRLNALKGYYAFLEDIFDEE